MVTLYLRYMVVAYVHSGTLRNSMGIYLLFCRVPKNSILGFIIRTYKKVGFGRFRYSIPKPETPKPRFRVQGLGPRNPPGPKYGNPT